MDILTHLAGTLGPRAAGSAAEHAAATFLADRLRGWGLDVQIQPFHYVGWRPCGNPSVEVLYPESTWLDAQPIVYSGSTPDEGVVGAVVRAGTAYLRPGVHEWRKYELLGPDGEAVGQLLVYPYGPPVPLSNGRPLFTMPTATIGQADQQRLDDWLAAGEVRARLRSKAEYLLDAVSYNIIATIPGEIREPALVLCAHYDSVHGSPGAVDNASGVEAVFRAASRLIASPPSVPVRLVLFAAEESSLLGSRFYVNRLKERGELARVMGVVNLDLVGGGDAVSVFFAPETLREKVERALKDAGVSERWQVSLGSSPGPGSDHHPFHEEGIPNVFLEFWPYAPWHRPSDTLDKVSEDTVERFAMAAVALIRSWSPE